MAQDKSKKPAKKSTMKKIADKLFGGGMADRARKEIKKRPNRVEDALKKAGA